MPRGRQCAGSRVTYSVKTVLYFIYSVTLFIYCCYFRQAHVVTNDRKPPKKKRKVNRPRSYRVSETEEDVASDDCHLDHPEYSITCNGSSVELSTNEVTVVVTFCL